MANLLLRAVAVVSLFSSSSCVAWRSTVVGQASFDHRCDRVEILRESGDDYGRSVDLNVCGRERRYRDLGGKRNFLWVDITEGVPFVPADDPRRHR